MKHASGDISQSAGSALHDTHIGSASFVLYGDTIPLDHSGLNLLARLAMSLRGAWRAAALDTARVGKSDLRATHMSRPRLLFGIS